MAVRTDDGIEIALAIQQQHYSAPWRRYADDQTARANRAKPKITPTKPTRIATAERSRGTDHRS